ncbi:IS66 family insertion sequence element accessory protein TnpB [Bradyrhizobium sp. CSS354]|uniref:IS66 family insertion sequence element accessory protein TnpB n=1 Tax=Bradyrhizobium sp. CSS354 TaxID=2699172 RepID=UPI0023B043F8|nr:IS66 family insertion sequence element accessory protein TnpB [Bradyrhizobium sp. CSS354]MDE5465915.1 hypothetical protein [Bradyrhizobium sp. CSS354]
MAAAVAFELAVTGALRRCSEFLSCCGDDDPDSERRQGLIAAGHTDMRPATRSLALTVQETLKRDPHAGDLYIFRERRGDLVKILGMMQ